MKNNDKVWLVEPKDNQWIGNGLKSYQNCYDS